MSRGTSTIRSGGAGAPAKGSNRALTAARSRGGERRALVRDALQELVPGLDERLRPFDLELLRECAGVDARVRKARYHLFRIAAVSRHRGSDLALASEREQRFLRHGIDGVGRRQGLDVQGRGGLWILGAGARPEHALLHRSGGLQIAPTLGLEELAMRTVSATGDRYAEPVSQVRGRLVARGLIPSA